MANLPRQTLRPTPRRTDRGVAYPSPVVLLSILAVAMAAVAFFSTRQPAPTEREITPASQAQAQPSVQPSADPTVVDKPAVEKKKKAKPIKRAETFVVVFNNTGITGLAGDVASQASAAGWQVVGADNWVGTIPTTTVYYPPQLAREAKQLALDLGISRVQPAVEPMNFDRLTVILTG